MNAFFFKHKKLAFWIIPAAVIACAVLVICLLTDPSSDGKISYEDTQLSHVNTPDPRPNETTVDVTKDELETETDMESLRERYPKYFDLNTFKGLEVYVWQMAAGSYSLGVLPGTNRNKTFEELMNLYDLRIKYFGNVKKYPTYYILGRKSFDYINYAPTLTNDATKQKAYGWLKEAIEKGGEKNEPQVFQQYFILSDGIYKANPNVNRDLYIADYMKIMPMMTAAAANDSTFDASIGVVNRVFARSGAAECGTLDKAYASKIEANKNDKAFLNDVLKLYRIADCKESAVYFKGSAYLHAIEPTAASAAGMAAQAISKKDNSKAIQYLQEAIKLETSKSVKSDYYLNIANIYLSQKNFQACRSNAQSALAMDPSAGQAYIMIAYAYAYGFASIDDDPVIQKTAYWAAVDKLEKAKAVDPSLASQANSLIASYKKQFPDKSELFMRGIKGGSYKVPGWIGETTTVR